MRNIKFIIIFIGVICVGSILLTTMHRSMLVDLKKLLKKVISMITLPGKMAAKRGRSEEDSTGKTPYPPATRLRVTDISAIGGPYRQSSRLAQQRVTGEMTNPYNMGTGVLFPISESYHDSTGIMDMSIDLRDRPV